MESYNTNYIVKIVGGDSEGRKPGMLLFMGSQRVGHEVTEQQQNKARGECGTKIHPVSLHELEFLGAS